MRVAHVEAGESSLAVLLHDRLTSQPVVDHGAGAGARTSDRLGPEAHRSPYLGFARTSCSLTVRHASGVRAPPPGEGELLDFGRRQVDVQADVRQTALIYRSDMTDRFYRLVRFPCVRPPAVTMFDLAILGLLEEND